MVGTAVLLTAEEDISRGEAVGGSEKFPVRIVKGERDICLGTGGHEGGGTGNIPAEAGDSFQIMEWDAEFGFAFVTDLDGGAVLAEVGTFQGDEEGVEVTAHGGGVC